MARQGAEFRWNNDFNPRDTRFAVQITPFDYRNSREERTFQRLHDPSAEADSALRDPEADAAEAMSMVTSLGLKWE